jgi:N,N'-diacetyllegionaminate synthase
MDIARKSIHLAKNVTAGSILSIDDLTVKRPGNGISSMLLNQIIGCVVKNNLKEDTLLHLKDIDWK